jgi:enoyl-CoA hydratase
MGETRLTLDIAGGVARATFETEGGLNVLSSPVLERIHAVAEEVRAAEGVRVMILAATGKVFVAGADIKELWGLDSAGARSVSELGNRAFDAIANLPCVTIARLHGAALGGGLEVALACDFRYALASAKIGLPESALGLVPGWKGISRVRALAGVSTVRRLTFTAAPITAADGLEYGLIDEVAEGTDELETKISACVESLRRGGPHAISQIKRVLHGGDEVTAFADCFAHAEAREGMTAFKEKRPPTWAKA